MSYSDNIEKFTKAFQEFHDINECDVTAEDWLKLFMKFQQSIKQGSGILWGDVKDIVLSLIHISEPTRPY